MLKIKRISLLFLILCMMFVLCSCGASNELQDMLKENTDTDTSDAVEASDSFFDSEETKEQENEIAEETGGELFHIERSTPYPTDYDECTDEAKQEQNENARPALMEDKDVSDYDVIFLGYAGGIIGLNQEKPINQGFALV